MAITKIHPIEKTLYLALDYIMNEDKTDEKILISSFACNPKTAHLEFEQTKRECNSKAKILARHLIQAFAPGETTPEQAHQIGLDLCEKILQGKYEYVLTRDIYTIIFCLTMSALKQERHIKVIREVIIKLELSVIIYVEKTACPLSMKTTKGLRTDTLQMAKAIWNIPNLRGELLGKISFRLRLIKLF